MEGDFGCLNVTLKPGYRTVCMVEEYVRGKLMGAFEKLEGSNGLTYDEVVELCHFEDFVKVGDYVEYCKNILSGNKQIIMHRGVISRLCNLLGVRQDEDNLFPFALPISQRAFDEALDIGRQNVVLVLEGMLGWEHGFLPQ